MEQKANEEKENFVTRKINLITLVCIHVYEFSEREKLAGTKLFEK